MYGLIDCSIVVRIDAVTQFIHTNPIVLLYQTILTPTIDKFSSSVYVILKTRMRSDMHVHCSLLTIVEPIKALFIINLNGVPDYRSPEPLFIGSVNFIYRDAPSCYAFCSCNIQYSVLEN